MEQAVNSFCQRNQHMSFDLPPVDSSLTGQVEQNFVAAEQQLQSAYKHRKARKKIGPEHFQSVQNGRQQSVPATESGLQSQKQAGSGVDGCRDGLNLAQSLLAGNNQGAPTNPLDVLKVSQDLRFPFLPPIQAGDFSGVTDVQSLLSQYAAGQSNGTALSGGLQQLGKQQSDQQTQNGMLGGLIRDFSNAEQFLGQKESGFLAKARQFTNIAGKFDEITNLMGTTAATIEGASGAVDTAALACAAIPFVGPAISAGLKVAANALRVVSKALQVVGRNMQAISKTMKVTSLQNKVSAQLTRVEKLAAQAKKVANQTGLQQGLARFQKIQEMTGKFQKALGLNNQNLQSMSQRLNELGASGKGKSASSGGGNRAAYELQLQQRSAEVEALKMLRSPNLADKQKALLELYTRVAGDNVEIAARVESKARAALAGSAYEPAVRLRIAAEKV